MNHDDIDMRKKVAIRSCGSFSQKEKGRVVEISGKVENCKENEWQWHGCTIYSIIWPEDCQESKGIRIDRKVKGTSECQPD